MLSDQTSLLLVLPEAAETVAQDMATQLVARMAMPRATLVAIEAHQFARVTDLFSLDGMVTLFDLTNTYFGGALAGSSKR